MSGKKALLVGLGAVALIAGAAPIVGVKLKYKDKDWGAIQDELTSRRLFFGKKIEDKEEAGK